MSESTSQDKSEKASPQKIKKAKNEGQIPRAKEFTTAVIFLSVTIYFYSKLSKIWQTIVEIFRYNMVLNKESLASPHQMIEQIGHTLALLVEMLIPLFLVIVIITIVSTLILGGWLFRPANIQPKLSKINPISGLKRMFSSRSLVVL